MSKLRVTVGNQFTFITHLEDEDVPLTCEAFKKSSVS
jgi:hypothetical protein